MTGVFPCPCQRGPVTVPDGTTQRNKPTVTLLRELSPLTEAASWQTDLISYISDMRLSIPVTELTAYVWGHLPMSWSGESNIMGTSYLTLCLPWAHGEEQQGLGTE